MPRTSIIQLLETAMGLHRYLKPLNKLPTPEQTGLSARITAEANKALKETLASQPRSSEPSARKRKYTMAFTPEDRAAIGKYAAEYRNAAAVKKFKAAFNVGESTVRSFKKKYIEELKKRRMPSTEF